MTHGIVSCRKLSLFFIYKKQMLTIHSPVFMKIQIIFDESFHYAYKYYTQSVFLLKNTG